MHDSVLSLCEISISLNVNLELANFESLIFLVLHHNNHLNYPNQKLHDLNQ